MKTWTATFDIIFKGEDVFYMDEKGLKETLNELFDGDDIKITSVIQIEETIKK